MYAEVETDRRKKRIGNKMAMGTIVGYWVVDSFVESVCNTKIPDLLVVMERARAGYLERFDAVILMLSHTCRAAEGIRSPDCQ